MDALPNEILLNIFDLLYPPITHLSSPSGLDRSRDLYSLCLVCQTFNQIATPLLYESIERTGNMTTLAYRQLPQVLLRKPKLRQYIKSIRLKLGDDVEVGEPMLHEDTDSNGSNEETEESYEDYHEEDPIVDIVPAEVQERYTWLSDIVEHLSTELGLPFAPALLRNAIRGDDIPITMCVFLAPNLERLWYRVPITHMETNTPCPLLAGIACSAFGTPLGEIHRFEKIRVLHIDLYRSGAYQSPVSCALPLLLLPSLVDLTLGGWGTDVRLPGRLALIPDDVDSDFLGKRWTWPVRSSSITKLSLLRPNVNSTMVAKMLLACRALSRFEIVHLEPDIERVADSR
jgi:hypothetical protein